MANPRASKGPVHPASVTNGARHVRKSRCVVCRRTFEAPKVGRPRLLCGDPVCWLKRRLATRTSPGKRMTCECQWCGYRHRTSSLGRGAPAPAASPEVMPAAPVLDLEGEGV